ncbi:hypothetical protein PDJ83_23685 [Bacillus cereus group sp. TH253LC]|nr:hypothetical protein [Bacillus cereus group sp. TH253LC]MDA1547400.1 hypothetical protein [Bacillus cereus group sp. TH253LC]
MSKNVTLLLQIVIGIIIIIAPIIITGLMYDGSTAMGNLFVAEFIMRTLSLIIGLLVISKLCIVILNHDKKEVPL